MRNQKLERAVFQKLIEMFGPADRPFLNHPASEVIVGPNDRALMGFNNYFPKEWLMEDYGFTEEEADWLIKAVQKSASESETAHTV